jgi:hypothetical protein
MISFKQNAVLKEKIKSLDRIKYAVRTVLKNPITLILFVSVPIYKVLFTPGGILIEYSLLTRSLIDFVSMVINYTSLYFYLPNLLRYGLTRNIPAMWLLLSFFIVLVFFESMFISLVLLQQNLMDMLHHFFVVILTVSASVLILPNFFRTFVNKHMAHAPSYLPFWFPVRLDELTVNKGGHEITGIVIRLKVEQNYTRIYTTEGDYLERGSLSEILQMVDTDLGIRIHRSMWIRKDRIEALVYKNGNPKVRTVDGELFPASRSSIKEIKEFLHSTMSAG